MEKSTIICIIPIKNEAWILERALKCHSLWADHIFIADQGSEDGSREIAERFEKVTLVESDYSTYDMGHVREKLLEAARKITGKRIIIALDADEMLSANWVDSPEWQTILTASEGTVLRFRWANILPNHLSAWMQPCDIAFGFVDDGREYQGSRISELRVPISKASPSLLMREMNVLHYQYTDWKRNKSKQRWYQCWERINFANKRPIQIYRQYHRMDAMPSEQVVPINAEWLATYKQHNIDMTSIREQAYYWWDIEFVHLLRKYGTHKFKKLDVWHTSWDKIEQLCQTIESADSYRDPRNIFDKWMHQWLAKTQKESLTSKIRWAQWVLILFRW